MMLPLRADSLLRHRPWTNRLVMLATLAVFVADMVLRRLGHPLLAGRLTLNTRDPRLGQFLTYGLVHVGYLHLAATLLALYIFGDAVNDRLGHAGYLAFYLAGMVFTGVAYVMMENASARFGGASGAAMAVMGAYLALYPRSNITIVSLFFGTLEIPGLYMMAVFFLFELAMNFAGTTEVAHLSGLIFGFTVAIALLYLKLLPRDQWDILAIVQRWHRRRQYQVLVRQGYNPFSGAAPPPQPRQRHADAEAAVHRIGELRAEISEAIAHHNLPHAALLFRRLRALDDKQVLSRQAQLDVANQLVSQQFYAEAAQAYEEFLTHYPKYQQIEHVQLMLGVIYARYLGRHQQAKALLQSALARLHSDQEAALARAELARIDNPSLRAK